MIYRSILLATTLIIGYSVFLHFCRPAPAPQELFEENVVKAQRYMYDPARRQKDVVIGTSLSDKLCRDSLPANVYLLTFPGQHMYDGLTILDHMHTYPKHVFIEMNSVLNAWDTVLCSYLFRQPDYPLRTYITMLNGGYQPEALFGSRFERRISSLTDVFSSYVFNPVISMLHVHNRQVIDEQFYYQKLKDKFNSATDSFAAARFSKLKYFVDRLMAGGSQVYFFRVPVSSGFLTTRTEILLTHYFSQYFPEGKYNYCLQHPGENYTTTDGLHFDDASALRYSSVFRAELDKYNNTILQHQDLIKQQADNR